MELVDNPEEISNNAFLFDSYRDSNSTADKMFYKARLRLGNIFIYLKMNNKDIFCPSRFAGYKNNNIQEHEKFAQKHGTHSTQKIDSILGKHTLKKEFEAIYQKLCNDVGLTPLNKKRQYWSISSLKDDLPPPAPIPTDNHPDEISEDYIIIIGAKKSVTVNAYERNEEAREKCIKHFGCECAVCGLTFKNKYGEIGDDFIHIHHLKPLSMIKEGYQLNPIKDLRPVCPNCHAMLHKNNPPFSVNDLKKIIEENINPV